MRLATFAASDAPTWGIIEASEAIDVGAVLGQNFPDLKSLIAANALVKAREAAKTAKRYPLSSIKWLKPFSSRPRPARSATARSSSPISTASSAFARVRRTTPRFKRRRTNGSTGFGLRTPGPRVVYSPGDGYF